MMTLSFFYSLQSEWLKKRNSLAAWTVIIGGFFTPAILTIVRLIHSEKLQETYASDGFWRQLWSNSWESMSIFLLPMGVVFATSLITQLEYKNNTWKQLNTLPLHLTTIFFAKLTIIISMMLQFFILFNIGIYLSALIPYLLIKGVSYPVAAIPYLAFLRENVYFFIDCLPIIALQYLVSLQFKNFIIPLGFGFLLWVAAIASLSWKYSYLIPYTYTMFNYLKGSHNRAITPPVNIHLLAFVYFILFTVLSYILYITKREKG